MTGPEVLNIRGVDEETAKMVRVMANVQNVTLATLLTLMAGEYLEHHRDEIHAAVRELGGNS
jgi:hypothetical protein